MNSREVEAAFSSVHEALKTALDRSIEDRAAIASLQRTMCDIASVVGIDPHALMAQMASNQAKARQILLLEIERTCPQLAAELDRTPPPPGSPPDSSRPEA